MKQTAKKGFTIIELMMGMVASTIVAIAVGAMLYYGWSAWRKNMEASAMQRDAMIAMKIMENRIRNSALDEIGWNASQITFANFQNFTSSEIAPDPGVKIKSGSFSVDTNAYGGVQVSFALVTASGADEKTYDMTIYPRN
jgi:Tfp pilus assembly protein PilW